MDFDVLAEGLQFPEGPIAMPDGSVILVEIRRGTLSRVWNGKVEVVCDLGGGPNGAALGPDGAVYVANNGGGGMAGGPRPAPCRAGSTAWTWRPASSSGSTTRSPAIPSRRRTTSSSTPRAASGSPTSAAPPGAPAISAASTTPSRTARRSSEVSFGGTGYNGIGLSPDEQTVYAAETYTGRLIAFDLAGPGQVVKGGRGGRLVGAAPGRAFFDSLAVQANGDICIASIADGITTMTPAGACRQTRCPTARRPTSASAATTCATPSSPSPKPAG